MTDTKLNLTISLRGNKLMSEDECALDSKNNYNRESVTVTHKGKRETLWFNTRKNNIIKQTMNISKEAYSYMISNECPSFKGTKAWKKMNTTQRLEAHLENIMEHLGGIDYTYEIFKN